MKKLFGIVLVCILAVSLTTAQVPQSFKYQAIARDIEGNVISDQQVSLRINLIQGSESGQVADSQGTLQTLYFSSPVDKFVHINLEISLYDEEQFPSDGLNGIKQAIVDYGDTFEVGDDLIIQRFYTPIYTVPGILNIEKFEFAVTEIDETVAVKESGTASSLVANELNDIIATFDTNGVVSGMVLKNTTDIRFASTIRVDGETKLTISSDIFDDIGDSYEVGVLGPISIPLASDELAKFAAGRITVSIV